MELVHSTYFKIFSFRQGIELHVGGIWRSFLSSYLAPHLSSTRARESHFSIYYCSAFCKARLCTVNNTVLKGAVLCLDVLLLCLDSVVGFADFQRLKADKAMIRV